MKKAVKFLVSTPLPPISPPLLNPILSINELDPDFLPLILMYYFGRDLCGIIRIIEVIIY